MREGVKFYSLYSILTQSKVVTENTLPSLQIMASSTKSDGTPPDRYLPADPFINGMTRAESQQRKKKRR